MARSAGLAILKWLLVPVALVAVGYYLVAPQVQGRIGPKAKPQKAQEPKQETKKFPAPEVDVEVGAFAAEKKPERPRRRRKRRTTPRIQQPPPEQIPIDAGGSGGAATTGGNG